MTAQAFTLTAPSSAQARCRRGRRPEQILRPERRRAALLAALIFSTIGLQVANPQIVRYFIDTALGSGPQSNLLFAAAVFLGAAVLLQALTVAATYVGEDVG